MKRRLLLAGAVALVAAGYAGPICSAEEKSPTPSAAAPDAKRANAAFDTMVKTCQKSNWKIARIEGSLAFRTKFTQRNGSYEFIADVRGEHPVVWFCSIAPFRVPEEKRPAMAEFLARANYGMPIGNFEMNYTSGEIRFKTSIPLRDGELTIAMVDGLVGTNVLTMDRYVPGMMSLLWAETSPETAISKVEKGGSASPPKPQVRPVRRESVASGFRA
jgi:hypothetical protein